MLFKIKKIYDYFLIINIWFKIKFNYFKRTFTETWFNEESIENVFYRMVESDSIDWDTNPFSFN